MYGKVMSVPDKAMPMYFRLVTRWTPPEIAELEKGLAEGSVHPRDVKMKLAREIVSIYHSPEEAVHAESEFIRVFQKGDVPEDMPEFKLQPGQTMLEVLVASGTVTSNSEGRRMFQQNAVKLDGILITDPFQTFPEPGVLQVGKRKFVRVVSA